MRRILDTGPYAAFLAVLLLLVLSQGALAATTTTPDIVFLTSNVEPVPVSPGDSLIFETRVQNWGAEPKKNVVVSLALPDEIYSENASSLVREFGSVCTLCSAELKYFLKVREGTPDGDYSIKVTASWDGGEKEREFFILVKRSAKLMVTDVVYNASDIDPGGRTRVFLTIKNVGTAPAEGWSVSVSMRDASENIKDTFSVPGAGNAIAIETLPIGGETTIPFELVVDQQVRAGVYLFPLSISFSQEIGSAGGAIKEMGPRLTVTGVEYDPPQIDPGGNTRVILTIKNVGSETATNGAVSVSMGGAPSDIMAKFSVTGGDAPLQLEPLAPGGETNISFQLAVDQQVRAGIYILPLTISFVGDSAESELGMIVVSKASLSAVDFRPMSDHVVPGVPFILSAVIENAGKRDAQGVATKLVNLDTRLSGVIGSYLGTIKAGTHDVALFELTYASEDPSSARIPLTLDVTYSDVTGQHEITENGSLVVERKPAKTLGVTVPVIPLISSAALLVFGAVFLSFLEKKQKAMIEKKRAETARAGVKKTAKTGKPGRIAKTKRRLRRPGK